MYVARDMARLVLMGEWLFLMSHLAAKLPPLRSLVAFEAVARHSNVTRAARELGISREAVSRHIRTLEEFLKVKLFQRPHGAIALTPEGAAYYDIVRNSLGEIANATDDVLDLGRPSGITVSSTIALASCWLTPRLSSFREKHPNLEIHVKIADAPIDLMTERADAALRYGDGNWPDLSVLHLFNVNSFPVCSPEYLKGTAPLRDPADLLRHTLVNLDGSVHAAEDWRWWLAGMGVDTPKTIRLLGFDSYANVMQATLAGQGVALGFTGLATDHLASGKLVRPLDAKMTKGLSVYLVTRSDRPATPAARSFMHWIRAEAAKTHD